MALAAYCLAYYALAGLAMVAFLHRGLAHGAVRFRFGLGRVLAVLALPAGGPVQWVGTHRRHHACADLPGDPHSPHLGGFWHAHCGWYLGTSRPWVCALYALGGPLRIAFDAWHRPRSNQEYNDAARDVAADAFLARLGRPKPYAAAMAGHLVPFAFAWSVWGLAGLAALWATLAAAYNVGDAVNSLGHLRGERPVEGRCEARNHPLLAMLAFGDGWHADHHLRPGSALGGPDLGRYDMGWMLIAALVRMRLARVGREGRPDEVRTPAATRVRQAA